MSQTARILIVDPDQAAVLQIAGAFPQHGWDVLAAGDAVLARSVIGRESASAIVLGSQLPDGRRRPCREKIRTSI